jgi:hypothetical protein
MEWPWATDDQRAHVLAISIALCICCHAYKLVCTRIRGPVYASSRPTGHRSRRLDGRPVYHCPEPGIHDGIPTIAGLERKYTRWQRLHAPGCPACVPIHTHAVNVRSWPVTGTRQVHVHSPLTLTDLPKVSDAVNAVSSPRARLRPKTTAPITAMARAPAVMRACPPWTNPVAEQDARRQADAGSSHCTLHASRGCRVSILKEKKAFVNTCRKHQTSSLQFADFTTRARLDGRYKPSLRQKPPLYPQACDVMLHSRKPRPTLCVSRTDLRHSNRSES